nr:integumentary mucin C.1-like [Nerophis lumbriciformis]
MEPTSASSNPQKATNLTDDVTLKPFVPTTLSTQAPNTSYSHFNATYANATLHEPTKPIPVSSTPSSRTATVETHPPMSTTLPRTTSHARPRTTQPSTTTIPTTSHSTTTSTTSQTTSLPSTQGTSSKAPPLATVVPQAFTSMKTKLHPDTPSQLNVNGETVKVHDSPTLDPLLAGLVSAFVVSAAVITLLLFLKLRRRDNRPEFRRLQDLPMTSSDILIPKLDSQTAFRVFKVGSELIL